MAEWLLAQVKRSSHISEDTVPAVRACLLECIGDAPRLGHHDPDAISVQLSRFWAEEPFAPLTAGRTLDRHHLRWSRRCDGFAEPRGRGHTDPRLHFEFLRIPSWPSGDLRGDPGSHSAKLGALG